VGTPTEFHDRQPKIAVLANRVTRPAPGSFYCRATDQAHCAVDDDGVDLVALNHANIEETSIFGVHGGVDETAIAVAMILRGLNKSDLGIGENGNQIPEPLWIDHIVGIDDADDLCVRSGLRNREPKCGGLESLEVLDVKELEARTKFAAAHRDRLPKYRIRGVVEHFFFGRDMTERKSAEELLRRLAHFDQLTGLPNRLSLHKDIDTILKERAGNPALPITVATLDLDAFKDVNDTLGHSVGDKLLQEVARRLTSGPDETRVYRLREDEFVLLLVDCGDPVIASSVVETLLKRLGGEFDLDGHRLFIAASAGIAISPNHGSTVDDLLANADLALYDAKAAGGRLCRLYVPTLRSQAKRRRELDMELRRACANEEFLLYFQPQVKSSDGSIVGAEALLRWRHPERGILAPGAFIDALCESAVAIETGRWILNSACKTAACWRAKGLPPIRIGVNLFPAQFRNGTLLQDVKHALAESGLAPESLELEITENIALGREEGTLSPLKELRAKGIGIAFDDFGTGYASLSYLTRYPLTRIKIDRSFIQQIGAQSAAEDTAIVRSIIVMGRNLGLQVIAEGVETAAQANFLKAEGCHELQGYLFSKPLPAEAFEQFLQSRASVDSMRVQGGRRVGPAGR
jgi:diguanylate cyclase (GGDEF)-like protein